MPTQVLALVDSCVVNNYDINVRPPSTTKICPVAYLVRNNPSVASVQSSGVPDLFNGADFATLVCMASQSAVQGVSMRPGATALMRTGQQLFAINFVI